MNSLPKYDENNLSKIYAGVGSRKTPIEVQILMNKLAEFLDKKGYSLNSGNALGADKAFQGAVQPWEKEESGKVTRWSTYQYKPSRMNIFRASDATDRCREIAKQVHPNSNIKGYVLDLHARNLLQVFGENLDTPIDFLICWTPLNKNGEVVTHHDQRDSTTGGTGQAISYASLRGIPVINMIHEDWRNKLTFILRLNKKTQTK